MLTYRRPEALALTLPLIREQVEEVARTHGHEPPGELLVIDNDPGESARATVAARAALPGATVRYVAEPEPGISAGRNRALDECRESDVLVFLDDDEHPRPGWLAPLIETWRTTGATGVMGRVVSEFEVEPEAWVRAGSFFTRRSMPTGTRVEVAAAGNLLLDLRQVRELGVRFDPAFGLTGGEDTMFSRELVGAGGWFAWCEESVATDRVPAERVTRRWVLQRSWSHGNTSALVERRLAPDPARRLASRVRCAGRGLVRMLGGGIRWALGTITRNLRHQARGARTAYRGAGMVAGALGHVYREYAREQ